MNVKVIYKKIKYMHLRVKQGEVCVSAPVGTNKEIIKKFVSNNIGFINNQIEKQKEIANKKAINYDSEITVLGNVYKIMPTSGKSKVTEHFIFLNDSVNFRKQIKSLFKSKLYDLMYEKTFKYFNLMSIKCPFPKITIKDVKSKWGSYNRSKNVIVYSSEIIFKDEDVYDYLIVHELAHILQFNHSKDFYAIVSKYCPNYKVLKAKLKEL